MDKKHERVDHREMWWREMATSCGSISAMIFDLPKEEIKSIRGWCDYLLKKKKWTTAS